MRSLILFSLILAALFSVGCASRMSSLQEEEQTISFYLRNIATGRLYGPFSGLETPPGGSELQVLLVPRVRKPFDDKDVSIGQIVWKAEFGEQPLSIDELRPIEHELALDSFFLKSVFTSDAGATIIIERGEIKHAWVVWRLGDEEAVLVRSERVYPQTHLGLNQLQVHRVLTGLRIEMYELHNATVHDMIEELKEQAAAAFSEAGILFSVEGQDAEWSQVRPMLLSLRDLRVIDLLEYISEVYGIMFRIDGNIIRLFPCEETWVTKKEESGPDLENGVLGGVRSSPQESKTEPDSGASAEGEDNGE